MELRTQTQPLVAKHIGGTIRAQNDRSRTRRTDEVPLIVACSHFTRKNTRFRAPASSPKHNPCNIMQPFQCDLQPEIPKHPITTHTQPHPKQLEATVTLRQKKNDKPTAAAPAAQTRYLSSSPAATLHGKTQGFVLRLPPQNRALATSCSHSNAICKHRFQKHPITTHTQAHPKQLEATVTLRQKKKTDKPTAAAPARTHEVPFIVACSHFTRKNTRFRAPASSPKHSPCNIMQPFQWDLQTTDSKTPYNYAHTSTPKAAWSHRYTAAKKKR